VVITGAVEGPSWFLLALGFLAYLRKSKVTLAVVLALAIFQRETLLLVFGCIAAFDLVRHRAEVRFRLMVCAWSAICFAAYLGLRRMVPGYEYQTHLPSLVSELRSTRFNSDLLSQGFVSQNVVIISVALAVAARILTGTKGRWIWVLLATLLCLDAVGLAAGIGNNIGRVGGILTPIFAALAAVDLVRLVQANDDLNELRFDAAAG
jgi:hypothetical protein